MKSWLSALVLAFAIPGCAPATPVQLGKSETHDRAARTVPQASLTERRSFRSELLRQDVTYHVYLPQSYATDTGRSYPVVYWLHGSGGYPPGALSMLASRFHNAMQSGRMPPAIIVFPVGFENTLWSNAADGSRPVEDAIVRELVPHMDSVFRTRASANGRLIEGASMGGYGAARLGLLYPRLFGAVSMINPGPMQPVLDPASAPLAGRIRAQATLDDVFGGSGELFRQRSPWTLAKSFAKRNCPQTRIRMVIGTSDPTAPTNLSFSKHLKGLGIAHDVELVAGAGHDHRAMFAGLQDDYWDFFAEALAREPDEKNHCS